MESPEGQKERRDAEAERKRAARAVAARMVEPPPLPPAGARLGSEPSSPSPGVDSTQPGASGAPGDAPPVPWQPEVLSDLVSELLDAVEESRVESFLEKCTEAKLMPKLIKEIEADVRFPKMAKIMLKRSLPRVAAKWLNKTGVSAEYQDELSVLSAVVLIVQSDRKNGAKLDEIIANQKPAAPAAPDNSKLKIQS